MKTAMQELIESFENGFLENKFNNSTDIIEECKRHLEKEKQQIIEACKHGANYENSPYRNAEDYYNETFS